MADKTKEIIRKEIKVSLQEYKQNFEKDSHVITKKIINSPEYKKADTVLSYMALPDEVNLNNNLMSLEKNVFIPKVKKETITIDFYCYNKSTYLKTGAYNIQEPEETAEKFNINTPEKYKNILILIPGRAFTINGKRLGRGKGYYDRFLKSLLESFPKENITLAGVCFYPQIKENLPATPLDISVDYIYTSFQNR